LETVSFRETEIAAAVPTAIAARGGPFPAAVATGHTDEMQNVEQPSTFSLKYRLQGGVLYKTGNIQKGGTGSFQLRDRRQTAHAGGGCRR
jgi:hypothetical protein